MRNLASAIKALIAAVAWAAFAASAFAAEFPRAKPEEVGLSRERLAMIADVIEADVAKREIPGAVVLIARRGKIAYFDSFGSIGPHSSAPMPADAIFRIYSMSKPITSVAAMILVEDGKLQLDDPVADYLPEFRDMRVIADGGGAAAPVSAVGAMTVQDLMRHTAGLSYGFPNRTPIQKLYARAGLWDEGRTNAEFAATIATLPLGAEPGTTWRYSHGTDVLGRLIEIVSGESLYEFEKERILEPLQMTDTHFFVADRESHRRIAEPFAADDAFGDGAGRVELSDVRQPKKWESGGAGMVSTALDYARFLQMLLNGGALDGRRIIGPRTVAYMTADHLGDEIAGGPAPGYGWSLAFAVRRAAGLSPMPGSAGDYFWFGAGGTSFFVDPKEDLFVIFMAQKPSRMDHYHSLMRQMVYASIVE